MFRGTATEQVSLVPRTVPELGQRPIGSMVFTGSSCDDRTVGWARLGWDDVITGGSIAISSDRPWETAAMLNEVLTETVIRPDRFVGKSSAARFFEQARTPPSWVFLEGLADAIENAFTVRLRDGSTVPCLHSCRLWRDAGTERPWLARISKHAEALLAEI